MDDEDIDNNSKRIQNIDKTKFIVKSGTDNYWNRIFSATMAIGEHIFNTPEDEHPLLIRKNKTDHAWVTVDDLQYMTLIMIYALVRLAWEKNILIIGVVKDIGASELTKSIIPLLQDTGMLNLNNELPSFGSDKMLLQINSLINPSIKAPWRTFEFDACFRTMVPEIMNQKNNTNDELPTIDISLSKNTNSASTTTTTTTTTDTSKTTTVSSISHIGRVKGVSKI